MKITETKENAGAQPTQAQGPQENTAAKNPSNDTYVPLKGVTDTDTSTVKKFDTLVRSADNADDDRTVLDKTQERVTITNSDKLEFLKAVTTGNRFVQTVDLFGGNLRVKFRSRSVDETEAILAYMHKSGIDGKFVTKADVSDTSLAALLVAQVAEINGVEYAEMKKPLKFTEDLDGVHPPAWEADLDIWRSKPESLISALGAALVEFEAKYWKMVGASRDENFWNPGGSTGK